MVGLSVLVLLAVLAALELVIYHRTISQRLGRPRARDFVVLFRSFTTDL
jgi:hypothetical protein